MNENQPNTPKFPTDSMNPIGRIGWVGLGHMGVPMAKNVLKAGFPLRVYNRTRARSGEVQAEAAETPAALARAVDTVVTMLGDDAALESVVFGPDGLAQGLRRGMLLINMGTHSPDLSRELPGRLAPSGARVLDAPVSGSVQPAAEGKLVILVGGEKPAYDRACPLFNVLGKRSFYFGTHGQGTAAKLAVNMMLGLTLQALAEAVVLGGKAGLSRDLLLEMISETACASPIVNLKMPAIRADKFPAAFPLKHMEKDFGFAAGLAKKLGASLPLTEAATETYRQAGARGLGNEDIMAILAELRARSP